jgi:outer membrane protein assembly factor BamA
VQSPVSNMTREFAKLRGCNLKTALLLSFVLLWCTTYAQFRLVVQPVDEDSSFLRNFKITNNFKTQEACVEYVATLPDLMHAKGYIGASVDSLIFDSMSARVHLFAGTQYKSGELTFKGIDKRALELSGFNATRFHRQPVNLQQLEVLREKLLQYYDENGYPFARLRFDSIALEGEKFRATLEVDKGPAYHIDSIRINGNLVISNKFMQRYLNLPPGALYQKSRLTSIDGRLLELPYLQQKQPWDMTMLGTGSILNLYLQQKKSSQVNVLIGVLPSTNPSDPTVNNKLIITGDANINLRNALGKGESIGLNWQQLQPKSPRLNLLYQQPYVFGSAFGVSTTFDLYKKDSAYLNLNFTLGLQYALSVTETGKVFFQNLSTNLLSVDTARIIASRTLPIEADVRINNIGVDYDFNKTDYRFNPRRGSQLHLVVSAGTKKIKENNAILKLTSPGFDYKGLYDTVKLNSYQFRLRVDGAHYFPLTKSSVLKLGGNIGWVQSPAIYRNELFQIGGYRLLRGFDEESIFASQFAVATIEYRYLIGLNSFLFSFIDAGGAANKSVYARTGNGFIGGGIGLALETKAGIFNLSLAEGKRNDLKFNLRQSKIHLGFVSYF